MSQIGKLNNKWAFHIINQLIQQGVHHFCIASGSRNTPLVLAIAQNLHAKYKIHFDERALGFHALGFSLATKKACAIVVTSGTAVGNLLPAIMEAKESQVPLLIFSADRPYELKDTGANQCIDQTKIFQNFVNWQCEIAPTDDVFPTYLRSTISYAVFQSEKKPKGPVHINCQFREPLFFENFEKISPFCTTTYYSQENALNKTCANALCEKIKGFQKGVIIVGITHLKSLEQIVQFSQIIGWPIYLEVSSRVNVDFSSETVIRHFPHLVDHAHDLFSEMDCIVQFGDRLISKKILSWIKTNVPQCYILITEHNCKRDELNLVTDRVVCSFSSILSYLIDIPQREVGPWMEEIKTIDNKIKQLIQKEIETYPHLTEIHLFDLLQKNFANTALFIGNSLAIREANNFFFPSKKDHQIFSNRGVSGIDGNISTSFGIANGLKKPVVSILGDLTFLHDLTSLHLAKDHRFAMTFFVLNNCGGALFSHLPIFSMKQYFAEFFLTPHSYCFQKIAEFFGFHYVFLDSKESLTNFFQKKAFEPLQIIELNISHNHNREIHQKIADSLKRRICLPSKPTGVSLINP